MPEKEKLHILHVVRQYHPAVGGLEAYVKNMVRHQQGLGHRCEVLTLNQVFHGDNTALSAYETIESVPVHRVSFLGIKRFFIPLVRPSFFKKFDIIHVHNTDGFFDYISWLAPNKAIFATTHGGFFHTSDFTTIKKAYFKLITRFSGKRYKALFAISQNDFETFRSVNDNLLLKPNAIVPPGDFLAEGKDFIYLGRLAPHKNIPGVIKTFAVLKNKHQVEGHLHLVGPAWDLKAEDLTALAQSLGIAEAVTLHGFVSEEELGAILKQCGWFLSASTFEGFGMSMLEAMAVGLIPFVQPNESFQELIAAGGVGKCVDFTDAEKAAGQIVRHLPVITKTQREKARAFSARFSWEGLASDTIKTYREHIG